MENKNSKAWRIWWINSLTRSRFCEIAESKFYNGLGAESTPHFPQSYLFRMSQNLALDSANLFILNPHLLFLRYNSRDFHA